MRWNHVQTDPPTPTAANVPPTDPFRPLGEAGGHQTRAALLIFALCYVGRPMGAWSEDCGGTLFTEHPVLLLRREAVRCPLLPDGAGAAVSRTPGGFLRHRASCPAPPALLQPARRLLPFLNALRAVTGTVTQWGFAAHLSGKDNAGVPLSGRILILPNPIVTFWLLSLAAALTRADTCWLPAGRSVSAERCP